MARNLTPLLKAFEKQIDEATDLVQAAEQIRMAAPKRSHARQSFSFSQIEAMYELAYLRAFAAWETFLEESFFRLMCGYESGGITHPTTHIPRPQRIEDAKLQVLNGRRYILWHDPGIITQRAGIFFTPSTNPPHNSVISSASTLIKDYSDIRHHIAHLTEDTCRSYHNATMRLCGARFGRRAGRFLRSSTNNSTTGANSRWLNSICNDLKSLASQFQ